MAWRQPDDCVWAAAKEGETPALNCPLLQGHGHSPRGRLKYLMDACMPTTRTVYQVLGYTCTLKTRQVRCGVTTQKLEGTGSSLEDIPKGCTTSGEYSSQERSAHLQNHQERKQMVLKRRVSWWGQGNGRFRNVGRSGPGLESQDLVRVKSGPP